MNRVALHVYFYFRRLLCSDSGLGVIEWFNTQELFRPIALIGLANDFAIEFSK